MAERGYVVGGSDGWLRVKTEPGGSIIALPEFLEVERTDSGGGRDYFTALEGVERSNRFSVSSGNLRTGNPGYRGAAALQFRLSSGELTYGSGKVKAITRAANPVPLGVHRIQISRLPAWSRGSL